MARKIEKKVISDDLLFGDDFDEGKLAKIEASLVRTPISDALDEEPGAKKGKAAQRAASDEGEAVVASSVEEDLDQETSTKPPPATQASEASQKQQAAIARIVRSKRLLLMAAVSALVIITAGLVSLYWFYLRQPSLLLPQTVRHPIVIPSYRHVTSFLLWVSPSGKKQDLLKVDVELDFRSAEAYEAFKSKQVLFCDVIYKFLRKQEPPDNSFEHWEKILEKNLFESLKHNYPETRLSSVQMKGFQRL